MKTLVICHCSELDEIESAQSSEMELFMMWNLRLSQ